MTEILKMALTPQLRKLAIKKRASHPSSIREPGLDFRKLVDNLEQAEITMKLKETKNLKLQYVNNSRSTTTQINQIHNSDVDLSEKITEILNIYVKNPNFKGKPSFKKVCNYCQRYGRRIAECRQKQQDTKNKPQKYTEPNKSFHQYMKKNQNLPNKNVHSNDSSGTSHSNSSNYSRKQSPYNSNYRGRSPEQRNSRNFSQKRYSRSNSRNIQYRNNYWRSNSNRPEYLFIPVPTQTLGIDTVPTIDQEIHRTIDTEIFPTIEIKATQIAEIIDIKTIDREIIQTIDQIIEDLTTTINKIDHKIIHKIETQTITLDKETIFNHLIGIKQVITILSTKIEAIHQNIKGN